MKNATPILVFVRIRGLHMENMPPIGLVVRIRLIQNGTKKTFPIPPIIIVLLGEDPEINKLERESRIKMNAIQGFPKINAISKQNMENMIKHNIENMIKRILKPLLKIVCASLVRFWILCERYGLIKRIIEIPGRLVSTHFWQLIRQRYWFVRGIIETLTRIFLGVLNYFRIYWLQNLTIYWLIRGIIIILTLRFCKLLNSFWELITQYYMSLRNQIKRKNREISKSKKIILSHLYNLYDSADFDDLAYEVRIFAYLRGLELYLCIILEYTAVFVTIYNSMSFYNNYFDAHCLYLVVNYLCFLKISLHLYIETCISISKSENINIFSYIDPVRVVIIYLIYLYICDYNSFFKRWR